VLPRDEVLEMVNGYEVSRAIQVAAVLGVADFLRDGSRSVDELADLTSTQPAALYRLLRVLAGVGVFREHVTGCFGLNARSEYLRSDIPDSLRFWAIATGGPGFWSSWGDLLETVRTGETAFTRVHGMNSWEYCTHHPHEGTAFDAAMASSSRAVAAIIADSYDFSSTGCVADIGGGRGALLGAIVAANSSVRGILFDQARVLVSDGACLELGSVAERCEVVVGDFFESVPAAADAYILKSVITNWDDQGANKILRNCRAAMRQRGKLLLVEPVLGVHKSADHQLLCTDLRMLVMTGGRVRTAAEFQALLAAAGFALTRIIPTDSRYSIIEGVPDSMALMPEAS
jgi:hypothetical protein